MAHSKLGKALDQNKLNVPPKEASPGTTNVPYVIVGDEAPPPPKKKKKTYRTP